MDRGDIYHPIGEKEIRLLTVLRGQLEDPVRCTLETVPLFDEPPSEYESISYCWGDATRRSHLEINGHVLDVPSSSQEALRRIRLPDGNRKVWIDALCINQADLEKRGSQVALMGSIYRKAAGNLIYLGGQQDTDTTEVDGILEAIVESLVPEYNLLSEDERKALGYRIFPKSWESKGLVPYDSLRRLLPLYSAPWFQRLWTLQEAALAKQNTCYWGNSTFPLEAALLIAWIHSQTKHSYELPLDYYQGTNTNGLLSASSRHCVRQFAPAFALPALMIFSAIQDLAASEPRDRVFAVLELMRRPGEDDETLPLLTTSYYKPIVDVYRDATRYLLARGDQHTGLLERISHRSDEDIHWNGKTSWTTLWDRPDDILIDPVAFRPRLYRTSELNSGSLVILSSGDERVLSLEGFALGKVTATSPQMTNPVVTNRPYMHALVERILASLLGKPYLEQALIDAFPPLKGSFSGPSSNGVSAEFSHMVEDRYAMAAKLLTAVEDRLDPTDRLDSPEKNTEAFKYFLHYLRHSKSPDLFFWDDTHDTSRQKEISMLFYQHTIPTVQHRRFFSLQNGYAGFGPNIMRAGDVAVAVKGGPYPMILRPVCKNQYQFIGAAYVQGLMNGEVFERGVEARRFDII